MEDDIFSLPSQKYFDAIGNDESHVVTPIHRAFNPEELIGYSPVSLNSKWMCNIFLWKNMHGDMGTYASFGHYAISHRQ